MSVVLYMQFFYEPLNKSLMCSWSNFVRMATHEKVH